MKFYSLLIVSLLALLSPLSLYSQAGQTVDYNNPRKYIIGGVQVSGIKYLSKEQILSLTGLREGDEVTVPGEVFSDMVKRLMMQRYLSSVGVYIDSVVPTGDTCYFELRLQERPRVSQWNFSGIKKSEKTDLMERVKLRRGGALSDYIASSSMDIIKRYYHEKGFLKADVSISQEIDTVIKNAVRVTFNIDKGPKVKIQTITFAGNENVKERKLVKSMKKTRDMRITNFLKSKKFNEKEYVTDKQSMISVFNEAGYRDARIIKDSIYYITPDRLGIDFVLDEGKRYYFRDITWTGNSVYTTEQLNGVLRIGKGDIYDVVTMDKRLNGDPKQQQPDIKKMYTDNGYLFFNVVPVEMKIEGDSVDVQMRIFEGEQATFNNIIINGNTITNEKIARRALFTRPGYLFSQTDLERSIRELSSIGHFDPEKFQSADGFSVLPNQVNNTVDIAYNLEEKANSQLELSGGWGGDMFVGTLGVSFNNFSLKRIFDKKAWRPVPLGDGQTLAIRFQTNGTYYTALTANFVEPWLWGKKPTALNVSAYYTRQTNSYYFYQNSDEYMEVFGAAIGIGTRLKWPDNYFVLYNQLSWQTYNLKDWYYNFLFSTGKSNNFSYMISLNRNSTDQQIYPRKGSDLSIGLQITPPYSLFRSKDTDYENMSDQERYRWIEYHKWTFKADLYTQLAGDLVLKAAAHFGYLGYFNRDLGYSPFEGFILGGDGMSGYTTYGADIIGLRGYPNNSLTPIIDNAYAGNVYDKFTIELRYPLVMQPSSTIFALVFLEGGNCWSDIKKFNPFSIKRSAGVGLRVMLPIVGMLGVDWGYGFDPVPNEGMDRGGSQFHFMIGQQF
ncbi:MAG: BamA/TamA family outer membrane protein [Bacteroidetes bacterium]|uniref:BamA/TamA family outer membrane protein n=1 Tax=Candidatus Egerieousia excrementavium TaxID=2840778 RepID=A0A9D9GXW9_9BACT|nr:BamA/TamA family outer membrane protein [Candidatus Egerieousia excrementavium]